MAHAATQVEPASATGDSRMRSTTSHADVVARMAPAAQLSHARGENRLAHVLSGAYIPCVTWCITQSQRRHSQNRNSEHPKSKLGSDMLGLGRRLLPSASLSGEDGCDTVSPAGSRLCQGLLHGQFRGSTLQGLCPGI